MPMMNLDSVKQKGDSAASKEKGNEMKTRSTYTLLVRSEEKERNILEIGLYATFGLGALIAILQFVQQPDSLPFKELPAAAAQAQVEKLPS
jgi:hypothetical protein